MDKVTAEEYARYQQQYDCFQRLCAEFDKPGDDMAPVMALMQEVPFESFYFVRHS